MSETFDRIKNLISEHLDVDEGKIVLEASFADDLGADSLDIVELIMAFEENFEIEIPDEDAQEILTVKDVVDYVDDKVSKKEEL
ncbi:MAG TPA: acyl carrier protein [Candidatus Azoamicus sp. MARI]